MEELVYLKQFWLTVIIVGIYVYLKFVIFNYWKRKGVPHQKPLIPFGNILPVAMGKSSLGKYNLYYLLIFFKIDKYNFFKRTNGER